MVKNSSNSSKGLGNTKPNPKQHAPAIRWSFTINYEKEITEEEARKNYSSNSSMLKTFTKFFIYSLEKVNNIHIQGYLECVNKMRMTAIKDIMGSRIHLEVSKGNREHNINYCSKTESQIEKPIMWDKSKEPKYTAEELGLVEPIKLYNWQREAINIASSKPDRRTIHWFFETEGNVGKTELARHLIYYHKFGLIDGKKKDIMCSIVGDDGTKEIMKGYVFNFSRDKEGKVSYDSMESIKDGLIFSSKYKSTGGIIPPCHIFVFANWMPDITKMSLDRWKIYNIKDKALIELNKPHKKDIELEDYIENYNVSF